MWAAWNDHADCARLLLDAGADMNAQANVRASTLIFFFIFLCAESIRRRGKCGNPCRVSLL
jgi:ankyrin repeat protein